MYYLAKILQAAGLGLLGIGFVLKFPKLVDHTTLLIALTAFGLGWIVEKVVAK